MNVRFILPRLLSLLAILGLLTGFVAQPAAARDRSASMATMADMGPAGDCAHQHKQTMPDPAKSRPCAAACAASCLPNLPMDLDSGAVLAWTWTTFVWGEDHDRDRLRDPPPSRPPRA